MFDHLSADALEQEFQEQYETETLVSSNPMRSLLRGASQEQTRDVGLAEAFAYASTTLDTLRDEMAARGDCPPWAIEAVGAQAITFGGYSSDHLRYASLFTADAQTFLRDSERALQDLLNARGAQQRAVDRGLDVPLPLWFGGPTMDELEADDPFGDRKGPLV